MNQNFFYLLRRHIFLIFPASDWRAKIQELKNPTTQAQLQVNEFCFLQVRGLFIFPLEKKYQLLYISGVFISWTWLGRTSPPAEDTMGGIKYCFPRARSGNVVVVWDLETAHISVLEEDVWRIQ